MFAHTFFRRHTHAYTLQWEAAQWEEDPAAGHTFHPSGKNPWPQGLDPRPRKAHLYGLPEGEIHHGKRDRVYKWNGLWISLCDRMCSCCDFLALLSIRPLFKNCSLNVNLLLCQFNRRHHCRRCGRLVCHSCSSRKMVVEGSEEPVRVCDQCFNFFHME